MHDPAVGAVNCAERCPGGARLLARATAHALVEELLGLFPRRSSFGTAEALLGLLGPLGKRAGGGGLAGARRITAHFPPQLFELGLKNFRFGVQLGDLGPQASVFGFELVYLVGKAHAYLLPRLAR